MRRRWIDIIWGSKYLRGTAIFTLISFGVSFINYLFNFATARLFPLSVYGEYMTALAYLAILTVPLSVLNILLVKKIGSVSFDQRFNLSANLEKQLGRLLIAKSWLILTVMIILIVGLIYKSNLHTSSAIWIIAMILVSIGAVFYSAVLQAYKYFWQVGIVNVMTAVVKIILIFIMVKLTLSVVSLYSVILASVVAGTLWSRKIAIKSIINNSTSYKDSQLNWSQLWSKHLWLPVLSTLGLVGMLSVDMMVVKSVFSASEVGLYAGLSLFGKIIFYITAPLTTVAFAYFTGHESQGSSSKILSINSLITLILGLLILTSYVLKPDLMITLVLGIKFISLAPLIYKAAIFGLLYSLINLYSQYALSRNHLISVLPIVLAVVQTLTLFYFHQNFNQVMNINIVTAAIAGLVYLFWWLKKVLIAKNI